MANKNQLVKYVKETIEKYDMLDKSLPVPIAFSGGKDSAAAIYLLDQLDYDVRPVIVDRGDDPLFNSSKIKNDLWDFGYDADIINLRDPEYLESVCSLATSEIEKYLNKFDNLKEGETYCTPCYNARTIALTEYTLCLGSESFVIGQHKTDMVTSLMKCYWTEQYWNLYTKQQSIPYNGSMMKKLIEECDIDLSYLENMVKQKRAATDDPPVEIINKKVKLVRPLCAISEREIESFIKETGFPWTSNNCSYREKEPRPFRLLVQFDLRKRFEENPTLEDILYEFVLVGLHVDGTLKFRPRNKREEYWPCFKPYIKKL